MSHASAREDQVNLKSSSIDALRLGHSRDVMGEGSATAVDSRSTAAIPGKPRVLTTSTDNRGASSLPLDPATEAPNELEGSPRTDVDSIQNPIAHDLPTHSQHVDDKDVLKQETIHAQLRSPAASVVTSSSHTAQDPTMPSGPPKSNDEEIVDFVQETANVQAPEDMKLRSGTRDFGFLPIPKRLQWDPEKPPEFTLAMNLLFGLAATWTVSSLYYPQPILIALSRDFNTSYESVTNIPTLLQASYALGLVFITPLGDLVRRRPLLLLLVATSALLSLILALVPSLAAFEAISFFLGAVSVTPQVLIPLAGDLAKPERRASALSIVLAGLLLGILYARFMSGLITEFATVSVVYYVSFGLLVGIWSMLYLMVPDYPAKGSSDLTYFKILRSMAKYAVTEPVLVQGCIIGLGSSATFSAFWTTSTFLLGDHYGYDTFVIGLFALIGIVGVLCAPFTGRLIDRLIPWVGVLIGLSILFIGQTLFTATAGLSIGAMVVIIILLDLGQQVQQVGNATRIFGLDAAGRSRRNAVYIFFIFVGQLIGTSAGTRVYLKFGGYRASGALCMSLLAWNIFVLCLRGPNLPTHRWIGWDGGWELRKAKVEERSKKQELEKKGEDLPAETV